MEPELKDSLEFQLSLLRLTQLMAAETEQQAAHDRATAVLAGLITRTTERPQ